MEDNKAINHLKLDNLSMIYSDNDNKIHETDNYANNNDHQQFTTLKQIWLYQFKSKLLKFRSDNNWDDNEVTNRLKCWRFIPIS